MSKDVIVIGASAGGLEAVSTVLGDLPADLPAAICVVIHVAPTELSFLPQILSRAGKLRVKHPEDREILKHGLVYVAPPDRHLVLEPGRIRVFHSPKENRHRPAIDPLFRSAAYFYRSRVIGVLLTGNDSDGTLGLLSIQKKQGLTVVQDPGEALWPVMPFSALTQVKVDHLLGLEEIGPLLVQSANGYRAQGRGRGRGV